MAELVKLLEDILGDTDASEKIKSLLGSESSDENAENSKLALPDDFDPSVILKMTKAMSAMSDFKDDTRAKLLCDLKPYISGQRRRRVDEAVQILRLLRMMDVFKDDIF